MLCQLVFPNLITFLKSETIAVVNIASDKFIAEEEDSSISTVSVYEALRTCIRDVFH